MSFFHEQIDGTSIRLRRHRRNGAPTLLLTNAWPMSIRCWDSHWEGLGDFNMLAYDMPGFGLSEGGNEYMSPSRQAAFALKVMDHFELSRVHGIGPDVGVPAMLSLAADHPERLHSVVVFNGPGTASPFLSWEIKGLVVSAAFRAATGLAGSIFASEAFRRGYQRFKPSPEALEEYRQINRSGGGFRRTLEYLASYGVELPLLEAKLSTMKVPTLILWGDKDPFLRVANAQAIHERIPGSRMHVLEGCGHFAHEDAGDHFTALVREWCTQHAA